MTSTSTEWWGFRIRTPLDHDPPPVSRWERTAAALLAATMMELAWWLRLVLGPAPGPGEAAGIARQALLLPAVLLLTPLILVHFLPRPALDALGLAPILIVSREKGILGRWDRVWTIVAIAVGIMVLLRVTAVPWAPIAGLVVLTAGAASLTLALFQPTVDFTKRQWRIEIPPWLDGGTESGEDADSIRQPDPGAAPLYSFEVGQGTQYPVGIRIPAEVLATLRQLNADNRGCLYVSQPRATVLLDAPPVGGTGREELQRFCAQILSILRHHRQSRLEAADAVLGFVQKAIRYGHDSDTTAAFPGGPYQEYGRFALETLQDGVGDCECTSIFCASLLAYLGYETALIHVVVPLDGGPPTSHLAVGLCTSELLATNTAADGFLESFAATDGSGRRFLYGESACDGTTMVFGRIPEEWRSGLRVESVVSLPAAGPARALSA